MGVSTHQVRTRQPHTSTRCSAILLNETKGPLQQHLQLQAGHYRAASSSNRLQAIAPGNSNNRGPAPLDIGATWYSKGKGNKGKRKGKGKYNEGRGCCGYGNNYSYNKYKGGTDKYNQQPVGQRSPFKRKGYSNKEKQPGKTERKESKQQMIATDADNQDTWPNNVERRSTTATLATSTPMTRQMTGTVRHTMAATGTTRIRHRCNN